MKALCEIHYPKLSSVERNDVERQSDSTNQFRLNQNFRMIADAILDHDELIADIPKQIEAATNPLKAEDAVSSIYNLGSWWCRKWRSGQAECICTTPDISLSISTDSGSMFYGEKAIELPGGLFSSVASPYITVMSASQPLFVSVKELSTTSIAVFVLSPVNALATFKLSIRLFGRWKEEVNA